MAVCRPLRLLKKNLYFHSSDSINMFRLIPIHRIFVLLAALWATISMFTLAVRYRFGRGVSALWRSVSNGGVDQSRPLRVLFVHRDLPFHGGVPRCLLYLARACNQSRIDFRLASFCDPSHRMRESFGELGISVTCL